MITSKQIIKFIEEYVTSKRLGSQELVVYSNPTLSEIKKLTNDQAKYFGGLREIRFIIDVKHQKIYCWTSSLAIHDTVFKILGFTPNFSLDYFTGVANCNHGKPFMVQSNDFFDTLMRYSFVNNKFPNKFSDSLKQFLFSNFDWLERYVTCGPAVSYMRDRFEKAVSNSK
jgi:hypothetical protein